MPPTRCLSIVVTSLDSATSDPAGSGSSSFVFFSSESKSFPSGSGDESCNSGRSLLDLRTVANLFFNCHPCLLKAAFWRLKLNQSHPLFKLWWPQRLHILGIVFPGQV